MLTLFADISTAAVALLQEMTDIDNLADAEEGASNLVDSLVWSKAKCVIYCTFMFHFLFSFLLQF